jgi:C4-dicarboxylate transporter DctM subunit
MSPTLIGIVGIVVMVFIFMSRMPVAYVMAMVGFVGFSTMISLKGGT